jgi:hypothetical protein
VRGDQEKYARERHGDASDDRSTSGKLELRDLRSGEPDSRDQDEQESDFRKAHARVPRQSDGVHTWHSSRVATPVSSAPGDLMISCSSSPPCRWEDRTVELSRLLVAIASLDHKCAVNLLDATPSLATARMARRDEFFLAERLAQVYEGDTALHAAGFSYDAEMARELITRGADIRARNRRGAEPLHAAVIGVPGSASWNPASQRDVIVCLIEAGADPNAAAAGGVTPLHRAVRDRCSAAVEALLRAGADPRLQNDRGSTAADLARWTTGRGGTGSAAARAEQRIIIELLQISAATATPS